MNAGRDRQVPQSVPSRHGPPLVARSVVASVLLGTDPPVMSPRALVRAGELFDLADGTVRTALSRMTAAGELRRNADGRYELVGHLAERRERQLVSRRAAPGRWTGTWEMWVVAATARPAEQRAELRRAARSLRLAELRDGVWLRPDNLTTGGTTTTAARSTMAAQATRFVVHPDNDNALTATLWDLDGWNGEAVALRREMQDLAKRLSSDDTTALQPGFVLAAAVLRLLNADPLLPAELRASVVGRGDQSAALRRDYETYNDAYSELLRRWLSAG